MKVDHFAFEVRSIDKSIEFYRDVIGLKFMFVDRSDEHGEKFAFFELEGGNLELLQKVPPPKEWIAPDPHEHAYCPHIALESNDIPGLVENLKSKGVKLVKGPLEIPGKVTWVYFEDLDGNIIEFVQWLE
ncbi:MAG: VOC family protein [Candidatus Hodarchaeota archaeon]